MEPAHQPDEKKTSETPTRAVSDLEMLAAFEMMSLPPGTLSKEENDALAEKVANYYSGNRSAPEAVPQKQKFAIDEMSEETREGFRRLAEWENGG
jgi:hypothetical protein